MTNTRLLHDTFVLKREFSVSRERVWSAISELPLKRKWFAESQNHAVEIFESDFRVGGCETLTYRLGQSMPFSGSLLQNLGTFLDIVPCERVIMSQRLLFEGMLISAAVVSFEVVAMSNGSELVTTFQAAYTQQSDGPAIRRSGWEKLMDLLVGVVAE
ncbi:MAG: SRPBCC domain-containing protein [Pirellulales bacterium]